MKFEVRGEKEKEKEKPTEFWLEKRDNIIILMAGEKGSTEGWHIAHVSEADGMLYLYECVPDNIGLALDEKAQIKVGED